MTPTPPFNPNSFLRQYVENTRQNTAKKTEETTLVMDENEIENMDSDDFGQNDALTLETVLGLTPQQRATMQQYADLWRFGLHKRQNPGGGESGV